MNRLIAALLVWTLLVNSATSQNQEAVVAVTPDWFQFVAGLPDEGGEYLQFRRYAFVVNSAVDGSNTFTDLRNIMTFFCALDPNQISYLLIFVPREIDVPFFLGGQYFSYKDILFAFGEGGLVLGSGEVQQNQLFFDVEFRNRDFFAGIRADEVIYLHFDDTHRLVMRLVDEELPGAGYSGLSDMVEGSIRGSLGEVDIRRASSAELVDACR